jgi:hypothetical protein
MKKNKEEVLYFISFPNNFLDNYYHFFLPVFLKHASIALNKKYFFLTLDT